MEVTVEGVIPYVTSNNGGCSIGEINVNSKSTTSLGRTLKYLNKSCNSINTNPNESDFDLFSILSQSTLESSDSYHPLIDNVLADEDSDNLVGDGNLKISENRFNGIESITTTTAGAGPGPMTAALVAPHLHKTSNSYAKTIKGIVTGGSSLLTSVFNYSVYSVNSSIPATYTHNGIDNVIENENVNLLEIIGESQRERKFIFKARNFRVNSKFLVTYALNRRVIDQIPEEFLNELSYYEKLFNKTKTGCINLECFMNSIQNKDPGFKEAIKVGIMAKSKLWKDIILDPREDSMRNVQKYTLKLIEVGPSGSIVRSNDSCKYLPWVNFETQRRTIKPFGVTGNNVQYTVKGWVNDRWRGSNHHF